MNTEKSSRQYTLAVLGAVVFTWLLHEFAHWLAYRALGYEAIMTLNTVRLANGEFEVSYHSAITAGAGPLVTILQASVVFLVFRTNGWREYLYPFLFIPFYMRLLAGLINIININDEGKVSQFFNLGTFTIPILVIGFLFILVLLISRQYHLSWKFQLKTAVLALIFSTTLILNDQFFNIRIL